MGRRLPVILAMVLALALPLVPTASSQGQAAAPDEGVVRLDATDAVGAAIAWSRFGHADDTADVVLLARDDDFADSLASGPLQALLGAPLLLTAGSAIDPRVLEEIHRLGASRVIVLGGEAAIGPRVVADLTAAGLAVERVAGADRTATAVQIADRFFPDASGAVVVRAWGDDEAPSRAFADALGAGSHAASLGWPLLLTASDVLSPATATRLSRRAPAEVVVVGGEAAVSAGVAQALRALVAEVGRIAGPERIGTSLLLADDLVGRGAVPRTPSDRTLTVWVPAHHDTAWASAFPAAGLAADAADVSVVLTDGDVNPSVGMVAPTNVCAPLLPAAHCDQVALVRRFFAHPSTAAFVPLVGRGATTGWAALHTTGDRQLCVFGWLYGDVPARHLTLLRGDRVVASFLDGDGHDPFAASFVGPTAPFASCTTDVDEAEVAALTASHDGVVLSADSAEGALVGRLIDPTDQVLWALTTPGLGLFQSLATAAPVLVVRVLPRDGSSICADLFHLGPHAPDTTPSGVRVLAADGRMLLDLPAPAAGRSGRTACVEDVDVDTLLAGAPEASAIARAAGREVLSGVAVPPGHLSPGTVPGYGLQGPRGRRFAPSAIVVPGAPPPPVRPPVFEGAGGGTTSPGGGPGGPGGPGGGGTVVCDDRSAVSRWIDQALATIRLDNPRPVVHARNLYHLSAAMWDAWAAYDPIVPRLFADDVPQPPPGQPAAVRAAAVAAAAHEVLAARYAGSIGAAESIPALDALAAAGCDGEAAHPNAVALGQAVAQAVLDATAEDGAEVDTTPEPVNAPLVVAQPGTTMIDPDRWQPLLIENRTAQNGVELEESLQRFVGWDWGQVTPFGFARDPSGLPFDPGPMPRFVDPDGGAGYRQGAVDVLLASSRLDPADEVVIDISPAAMGNSTLGTDDGHGHPANPATGAPYAPAPTLRADYLRAIAEHWSDGPTSETPPGHWNTIARVVSDVLDPTDLRIGGEGPPVDRLEWDVTLFLALNGALHDAAIAAWGVKAAYDSARPISMIRHLAGLGQSSDPQGPAHHPQGLPLVPGLVEVATAESTAPGGPHEGLDDHVGEVVVRAWNPTPSAAGPQVRVRWFPAESWLPYQQPTFVTPPFAGYVSGHSTFSRAAAVVLERMTGDPYFPGGWLGYHVPAWSSTFEPGPTQDVVLQWATYADAADEAGRSRIAGGIHVPADDHAGRELGAAVGEQAWARMVTLLDGP